MISDILVAPLATLRQMEAAVQPKQLSYTFHSFSTVFYSKCVNVNLCEPSLPLKLCMCVFFTIKRQINPLLKSLILGIIAPKQQINIKLCQNDLQALKMGRNTKNSLDNLQFPDVQPLLCYIWKLNSSALSRLSCSWCFLSLSSLTHLSAGIIGRWPPFLRLPLLELFLLTEPHFYPKGSCWFSLSFDLTMSGALRLIYLM